MDRCEILQPKLIGTVGAISQTGFLHTRLRSSSSPIPSSRSPLTRHSNPSNDDPRPYIGHLSPCQDALASPQRAKSRPVPAAPQRINEPLPALPNPRAPCAEPLPLSRVAKMAGGGCCRFAQDQCPPDQCRSAATDRR